MFKSYAFRGGIDPNDHDCHVGLNGHRIINQSQLYPCSVEIIDDKFEEKWISATFNGGGNILCDMIAVIDCYTAKQLDVFANVVGYLHDIERRFGINPAQAFLLVSKTTHTEYFDQVKDYFERYNKLKAFW